MAPPQCSAASEPPKVGQIIREFFSKALHVILEARSPCCRGAEPCSTSASSDAGSRDRWFNLALRELPGALKVVELWRQGALDVVVVDVVLSRSGRGDGSSAQGRSDRIIERWTVQYETRSTTESAKSSSPHRKLYKKAILLMRSLYAAARLLPAHRISQDLRSPGKARDLRLTHRVSPFAEPFTRAEDAEMDRLAFSQVDTPRGRLCLSVSYLPKLEGIHSVQSSPLPIRIIPDYIGSSSADGLTRHHSLPSERPEPARVAFTALRSLSSNHRHSPSTSSPPSRASSKQQGAHRDGTICPIAHSEAQDREHPDDITTSTILTSRLPIHDPCIGFLPNECSPAMMTCSKNSGTKTTSCGKISDKRLDILFSAGFQTETAPHKVLNFNTFIASSSTTKTPFDYSPVLSNTRELSLPIRYDDADVLFPFATRDDDARTKLSGGKGHAIKHLGSGQLMERPKLVPVGAVVEMLKTASPLHRGNRFPPNTSAIHKDEVEDGHQWHGIPDKSQKVPTTSCDSASGVIMTSRTTAHALEELRKYKQMKAFLLTQHSMNH